MAAKNPPVVYMPPHCVVLPLALLLGCTVTRYAHVAGDNDQIARRRFLLPALALAAAGEKLSGQNVPARIRPCQLGTMRV